MPLTAISPIDGRYASKTETLQAYFSEQALIQYRLRIEVEYFIALCEIPLPQLASFNKENFQILRNLYMKKNSWLIKALRNRTNYQS